MRKFLALLLVLSICSAFAIAPAASAASAAEEPDTSVAVLQMMGALQGDSAGALNLSGTLSRAQFCKIAVVVMGLSSKVSQYSSYTIFPDVPSTSWAAGYVNLAVRSAGIISGYPSGNFGPDDPITYGQAVTILMRMLGYTSAKVGAVWPDGYLEKAGEIGLTDGVSLTGDAQINRAQAAILFVNLLSAKASDSNKTYIETLGGMSIVSNVFLLSGDAVTDSGLSGAVKIAGKTSGTYLPVNTVPSALVGLYGSLVLNASGKALTFIPASSGSTVCSTVKSTTATAITCTDGSKITMSSSVTLYLDGVQKDYASNWYNIDGGMLISAYYSDGGAVQSVLITTPASKDSSVTVAGSGSFQTDSAATVYLDGCLASASDISQYDVVTYNAEYNVYNVSDKRITGLYEDAYPNTETPSTVTVLGVEFEVLDSACSALSAFDVGSSVTLLLTSDNQVAGVVSPNATGVSNYGIVESASPSSASVTLTNGITVSGKVTNVTPSNYIRKMVQVNSTKTGYLELYDLYSQPVTASLNVRDQTLGDVKLSPAVKIYEGISGDCVERISLSDLASPTVGASKITYVSYGATGKAELILLDDVTGDRYTYGIIENSLKTTRDGMLSATNSITTVENSAGSTEIVGNTGLSDDSVAGLAANPSGVMLKYCALTEVSGVSRYDFKTDADGSTYVTIGGADVPISDNVQVYIDSKDLWTTLSKARAYSNNLSVFYDKAAADGGKIRVVIAY